MSNEFMTENEERAMILAKYQEVIKKTAIYPKAIGIGYCALGLSGEAGEIANKVKKLYRDDNLALLSERQKNALIASKKDDLKAELGDVLWYVTALAQEFDLNLDEIMEYNMKKLLDRRERNVLGGSGDNR